MLFVSPESVHLQVEEVYRIVSGGVQLYRLFTVMSRPLLSHSLYHGLVIFTDVIVASFGVQSQFEFPLSHNALDPLAVGGVAGRSVARPAVLQETAVLDAAVATVGAPLLHSVPRVTVDTSFTSD